MASLVLEPFECRCCCHHRCRSNGFDVEVVHDRTLLTVDIDAENENYGVGSFDVEVERDHDFTVECGAKVDCTDFVIFNNDYGSLVQSYIGRIEF